MSSAAIRCGTKGCPNEAAEKVPDEKLPHVVYDLCEPCATGMRALRGVELIDKRNVLVQTSDRSAATIRPEELREYADLLVHRGEQGSMEERLLREAADELERVKHERSLVYSELNRALGEHAPKAWDRIKAAMDG